jgi:hypothetical protein
VFPDKPTNLTVTNITSKSAKVSWIDPKHPGIFNVSRFRIKLEENNTLLLDIITRKVNEYQIDHLNPFTEYRISVSAGNSRGLSNEYTITSFRTSEVGELYMQLKYKVIQR